MNRRESRQRRIKVLCGTALLGLLMFLAVAPRALALDPRDIVFECPCSAEWVAGTDGRGKLELSFGLRSFRATGSGDIDLGIDSVEWTRLGFGDSIHYGTLNMGRLAGHGLVEGLRRTGPHEAPRPSRDSVIRVGLTESTSSSRVSDHFHEVLTLWPVPGVGNADRIQFVDLLTDADSDGVGDVNERIAGTNPYDPASIPGESTVDILWLYDDGAPRDAIYARIHHLKAVTNSIYVDSGTNIRLRTVGIRRIEKAQESGRPDRDHLTELMEDHGADISHQVGYSLSPCGQGCAGVGGQLYRGHWSYKSSFTKSWLGPLSVAHELGHVMGLVHSATQGEAFGTFRWSRGHYLNRLRGRTHGSYPRQPVVMGTIMTYGADYPGRSFSDPVADCNGEPCGVPITEADGADARRSLDLLRFQVAAHRDAKPDSDDDGFVDDVDAAPNDPSEWMDSDGDGLGDNADPDADGDGVDDTMDRWPFDPLEWEDHDGDGVGDNADDAVEVQGSLDPFRDAALRRVVEQALGKSAGDGISAEEMAGLQRLRVSANLGVRDLTGIESATGLTHLQVFSNDVTDLSPLAGLTNLEYLLLYGNPITDLSPIAGLTNLEYLYLTDNPIADLSPVAGLTQLVALEVQNAFVADLSPLAGLTSLESLTLYRNPLSDLSPLVGLTNLEYLYLLYNRIVDLSPLSGLTQLYELNLQSNRISDVSPLSGLSNLQTLSLEQNSISNATPLSELHMLRELLLTGNIISDLSPLQRLANLETLGLGENQVTDLSPLSGLTHLEDLRLDVNRVTDLSPLASLSALRRLWVDSNDVSDLSPLANLELDDLDVGRTNVSLDDVVALPGFPNLRNLGLDGLGISDVRPLAGLSGLQRLALNENRINDVSPLAVREIWSEDRSFLLLTGNPLDQASVTEHVPLLESWGVDVWHEGSPAVVMPDERLRSLVFQQSAGEGILVDFGALVRWRMERVYRLYAFNAGVSDLTGLEAAIYLRRADLGSNGVSDLAPLSQLDALRDLNLNDNLVSDVSPLVGLDALSSVDLSGNPLTEASLNDHIPELRDEGVEVGVESVEWEIPASRETARFEVKGYFESLLGTVLRFEAVGDDLGLASIEIVEGVLEVSPRGANGMLNVTITATGRTGDRATLRFNVRLLAFPDRELGLGTGPLTINLNEALGETGVSYSYKAVSSDDAVAAVRIEDGSLFVEPHADGTVTVTVKATAGDGSQTVHSFDMRVVSRSREVSYLLPAGDERRQGLVRVINHSTEPGEVSIEAFDEAGAAYGPLTMPIPANGTLHFTSEDLERGNAAAGLSGGVGTGQGGWRLALVSERDIEVLSYIRTADGFLTAMHDVAPENQDGVYRVAIFNPGSDTDQVSVLRLVNTAEDDAAVTIRGIDEDGMSPGSDVQVSVPAGQARSFSAADLEAGTGVTGALGDGAGKWQLVVSSDVAIGVINLLESPSGYLSNLSTAPVADGDTWTVPLFPSASDALQRQGQVRVINRGDTTAEVPVQAFDESVRDYDPLTLTVEGGKTVSFDSNDLELGNTEKGLSGSTGAGIGDWWLKLGSGSDIEVLSYIGTPDGFFTSVHDAAPSVKNRHRIVTFNPGRNVDPVNRLRLINAGANAARVTIRGVDDEGQPANDIVRTSVPGHTARTYTAADLELGAVDLDGALGTGVGKWRLSVESDRPIAVMSLQDSLTTGRLTNLSTVPQGRVRSRMLGEGDGAGEAIETTYSVNDILPGVPSSGVFTPTIHGGGSILITGNDTTISLDDGAHFDLDDGTRYTCAATQGCTILNGTVTAGAVVGRAASAGEVDRFPSFRNAVAPGNQTFTMGRAIDALTLPEASGGNGTLSYSLTPSVPGLTFDATTRRLTGAPTTAVTYDMTYTVTDEDGDTDTLGFTIAVNVDASAGGSLGDCYPGLLVGIGQSCTYPGTTDEFSVNARGRGSFLGRLAGIRIRINNETINGRIYDFAASHQGDGVWRIDRIAGRTEP